MRARILLLVAAGALALGVVGAQAITGDLDPSFGSGGYTQTDFGGSDDVGYAVAIRGDQKIVVAGARESSPTNDFTWALYTKDGREKKQITTDFGADEKIRGIVTDKNNVIAAGWSNAGGTYDFALAKYTDSGKLDPKFGTGGMVTTDFGGNENGRAIAFKGGKIVVVGTTSSGGGDTAIARYNKKGQLDTSFDGDGKMTIDLSGSGAYDDAVAVAVQDNGKIVTAGTAWNSATSSVDWVVARFKEDGSPDPNFDGDGKRFFDFGGGSADAAFAITLYPGDKIVAGGMYSNGTVWGVERLNEDGSSDLNFSGDGRELVNFLGGSDNNVYGLATRNGVITAVGNINKFGGYDAVICQFPAGGGLNASFGGNPFAGCALFDSGNDEGWRAVVLQGNNIIAAGEIDAGTDDFVVGRHSG